LDKYIWNKKEREYANWQERYKMKSNLDIMLQKIWVDKTGTITGLYLHMFLLGKNKKNVTVDIRSILESDVIIRDGDLWKINTASTLWIPITKRLKEDY